MPAARAGGIYKCVVKDATVYQDQPCPGGKPDAGRLTGAGCGTAGMAAVPGDPRGLLDGLRRLSEQYRTLQAQQDRELAQLRLRFAGQPDSPAQRSGVERFRQGWQERFAENDRQERAMRDRLRTLCPGGASSGGGHYRCDSGDR
ncbi:hypothetical protein ASG87_15410 [Frateuria sp. Soil773]|nr:hypothetical protein ASG87_15410 [Frateuria sp. Soil773]